MSNTDERFWSKVDKSGECWTWISALNNGGYGVFWMNRGSRLAHRVAYEMVVGPVPEGMFLDHACHNRKCVNPDHLRVVSRKQNQENLLGANSRSTSGYRGVHRNHNGWSASVVHEQRTYHVGTFPAPELAAEAARLKRIELFTHNDADRA